MILLGFVLRAKKRAMDGEFILSVYFHKPSKKEFESCIKWLIKNKFAFLSTSDLEKIIHKKLPFPKGAVIITVDDGWQSNEENVISVAEKYQVPVTIFVSTEPVEEGVFWWTYLKEANRNNFPNLPPKPKLKKIPNEDRISVIEEIKKKLTIPREALTVDQVKKAASSKYITIGGHTHTHPILINCNEQQALQELKLSKKKLEDWTGKQVTTFAYPNGDFGNREVSMLKNLDYSMAFANNGMLLTPNALKDKFEIPRIGYLEGASFAENICRMVGIWKPISNKFKSNYKMNF